MTPPDPPATLPTVGSRAPAFTLPAGPDTTLSLDDLAGRPTVLVFYPADWSPVCGDQLSLYQTAHAQLASHDAHVVGISVDGVWCHRAFARDRGLTFPLLADFEPKGDVARRYGVYRDADGISERALFVLDADGVVRWTHVSQPGVNPGVDGILDALADLDADAT
jgi:peroxiredoxin